MIFPLFLIVFFFQIENGYLSSNTSSKGTIERFLDVARKQERLAANRYYELNAGKEPKKRRKELKKYEKRLKSAIRKHKTGQYSLQEYWAKIIELKEDFADKHLYK